MPAGSAQDIVHWCMILSDLDHTPSVPINDMFINGGLMPTTRPSPNVSLSCVIYCINIKHRQNSVDSGLLCNTVDCNKCPSAAIKMISAL